MAPLASSVGFAPEAAAVSDAAGACGTGQRRMKRHVAQDLCGRLTMSVSVGRPAFMFHEISRFHRSVKGAISVKQIGTLRLFGGRV